MKDSGIQWTTHTFNPWVGCQRVSPGCEHCYAETRDGRFHGGKHWGPKGERQVTSAAIWRQPKQWNDEAAAAGVRARVFCASLADVFEDRPELVDPRARLFDLIGQTPWLDWQLLTKRPENMVRLAPASWVEGWPVNVWAGTTLEDQKRADERIPHLLGVPAKVRFLSCEPLLGAVDLTRWVHRNWCGFCFGRGHTHGADVGIVRDGKRLCGEEYSMGWCGSPLGSLVNWVIVGGESGPSARPFDVAWARSLVRQCRDASVPVFVKQLGARPETSRVSDQRDDGAAEKQTEIQNERGEDDLTFPIVGLRDRKGGSMEEWPADLRVREFPEVTRG